MGKRKSLAPRRLDSGNANSLSWSLAGGSLSEGNNSEVIIINGEDGENQEASTDSKRVKASHDSQDAQNTSNAGMLILKSFLEESEFYITVYPEEANEDGSYDSSGYLLCDIDVLVLEKYQEAASVPEDVLLYIYVRKDSNVALLYWETQSALGKRRQKPDPHFWLVQFGNWPYDALLGLHVKRIFKVVTRHCDNTESSVRLYVYIQEKSALYSIQYPSQAVRKFADVWTQALMKHVFHIAPHPVTWSEDDQTHAHDIDELYVLVRQEQRNCLDKILVPQEDVQHADLVPLLRPYQAEGVRWMLYRENERLPHKDSLHILYEEIEIKNCKKLYYNKFGGFFVKNRPESVAPATGGILADEMGLGKTIEVLACILWNPRPCLTNKSSTMEKDDPNGNAVGEDSEEPKANKSKRPKYDDSHYYRDAVRQRSYFECICGSVLEHMTNEESKLIQVKCQKCGLWQHAKCVGFDTHLDRNYLCPHCWVDPSMVPVPSRATLIVSPSSISYQWQEEIEKHINASSLRVLVYNGVQKEGFIQPYSFSDYDIVLTTYETLRKEINYVDLPHSNSETGRRFRYPKRFMTIPSPLVAVEWWRICLDEAQMVECTTTKAAEMASRLTAVHRWCVTGTPIQKSIDDLYGLFLFLSEDPYWVKLWWKEILYDPYCHGYKEPLVKVLSNCFWRNSKKDVLDQIGIPPQTEIVHWLNFSPVEQHFYIRQHEECSRMVLVKLATFSDQKVKLNSLSKHTISLIMNPLRKLRQACCHPQVVKGQFLSIQKSMMTMEELLVSLIKKVTNESEEAHRQLIAAINGLAAIHIIKEEYQQAVENYRQVLRSVEEHKSLIKTDKLQQLHTLHNLDEILSLCSSQVVKNTRNVAEEESSESDETPMESEESPKKLGPPNSPDKLAFKDIGHTLRDATLKKEAEELKVAYLSKRKNLVNAAIEQLSQSLEQVRTLEAQFVCSRSSPWWIHSLNALEECGQGEALVQRVREELISIGSRAATRFFNIQGLAYIVSRQLDDLKKSHDDLAQAVHSLSPDPSQKEVNDAADCHLRPLKTNKPQCIYCSVHELFNAYEGKLFNFSEEETIAEPSTREEAMFGNLRRGTWANGELERILKTIYTFVRSQRIDPSVVNDGNVQDKLFTAMKKEFRALRAVWMEIRDYASAIDELSMAMIRFRLRYPHEPKPDPPVSYILEPGEVNYTRLKLVSEKIIAQNELRKKLGNLFYLQNLQKADLGKSGGQNPDPCPICKKVLGEHWSVLQCGHCFCVECMQILVMNYSSGGKVKSVQCAICRQMTPHGDIMYVRTKPEQEEEKEKYPVKGSHSTKVEGIVRCLKMIEEEEPSAKVLVFSTWQDVLDILAKAFEENDIRYTSLHAHNKFQENLVEFKYDKEIMCLLLPVHSGANGLNLIEATHVFLVEPVLNPASELQACGRVHRIGQTKPTKLHRFIVKGTIEERIYTFLKPYQPSMNNLEVDDHIMTLEELRNLFAAELNS